MKSTATLPATEPADNEKSSTVRVDPSGIEIEVRHGETVIQAAWRAGLEWPTLCYAQGTCTTCRCEVVEGLHLLSDRTEAEQALLADLRGRVRRIDPRRVRLACQLMVDGDITIRRPGVKQRKPNNDEEFGGSDGRT